MRAQNPRNEPGNSSATPTAAHIAPNCRSPARWPIAGRTQCSARIALRYKPIVTVRSRRRYGEREYGWSICFHRAAHQALGRPVDAGLSSPAPRCAPDTADEMVEGAISVTALPSVTLVVVWGVVVSAAADDCAVLSALGSASEPPKASRHKPSLGQPCMG